MKIVSVEASIPGVGALVLFGHGGLFGRGLIGRRGIVCDRFLGRGVLGPGCVGDRPEGQEGDQQGGQHALK